MCRTVETPLLCVASLLPADENEIEVSFNATLYCFRYVLPNCIKFTKFYVSLYAMQIFAFAYSKQFSLILFYDFSRKNFPVRGSQLRCSNCISKPY